MVYSKNTNMHKRMAMGEKLTGMKKGGQVGHAFPDGGPAYKSGGAVKAVHKHEKVMHPGKKLTPLRKGGKAGEC